MCVNLFIADYIAVNKICVGNCTHLFWKWRKEEKLTHDKFLLLQSTASSQYTNVFINTTKVILPQG